MKKRLFIGIPVSEDIEKFSKQVDEKNSHQVNARWTPRKNLHMTVVFLGSVEEDDIPKLASDLHDLAKSLKSFSLEWSHCSTAPARTNPPTMIWSQYNSSLAWEKLVDAVRKIVAPYMQKADFRQQQIPHITLARFRSAAFVKDARFEGLTLENTPFTIEKFCLYKSIPSASGSRYHVLNSFDLQG